MSTKVSFGSCLMYASISLRGVMLAVGLLGLQIYTNPTFSPAWGSIFCRSCSYLALSGTPRTFAPRVFAYCPSDSNVGDAWTSALPGPQKTSAQTRNISLDPQPSDIWFSLMRCKRAMVD